MNFRLFPQVSLVDIEEIVPLLLGINRQEAVGIGLSAHHDIIPLLPLFRREVEFNGGSGNPLSVRISDRNAEICQMIAVFTSRFACTGDEQDQNEEDATPD